MAQIEPLGGREEELELTIVHIYVSVVIVPATLRQLWALFKAATIPEQAVPKRRRASTAPDRARQSKEGAQLRGPRRAREAAMRIARRSVIKGLAAGSLLHR